MAKYETRLQGDFDHFLRYLDAGIIRGSASASYEDGSDCICGDVRCAVRVYERYSMIGNNRVSLNIVLLGNGDELIVSAITSGGSQAVFLKINTIGEESFLQRVTGVIEEYKRSSKP